MRRSRVLALLLALALLVGLFGGCGRDPAASSAPTQTAPQTEAPPALPNPELAALYNEAVTALEAVPDRTMKLTIKQERTGGGDVVSETTTRTARFQGIGAGDPVIHVSDSIVNGENRTSWEQLWSGGTAYAKLKQTWFCGQQTLEEFLQAQTPTMLPRPENYGAMEYEENVYVFSDPVAAESWAMPEGASLLQASATVVMADGAITSAEYEITFTLGAFEIHDVYRASFASSVDKDLRSLVPENTDGMIALESPQAPLLFYQAWHALNNAFSASLESSGSAVYGPEEAVMLFSDDLYNWGRGAELCYREASDTAFLLAEDADNSGLQTETSSFQSSLIDGVYVEDRDGVEAWENVWDAGWNPERYGNDFLQLLHNREGQLIPGYNSLTAARIQDGGNTWRINFSTNAEYGKRLLQEFSEKLYGDASRIGAISTGFSFGKAEGWLELEKRTWLPTALSVSFEGVCTIDSGSFPVTLHRFTDIRLCDDSIYETITGLPRTEEETAEPPTPLFYQVQGANGEILWLLGTIHAGDNRTAALPQPIYEAFDSSDALALEMDPFTSALRLQEGGDLWLALSERYVYSDGSTIAEHISPALYETAARILTDAGRDTTGLDHYKPIVWDSEINSVYQQGLRLDRHKGVDNRLAFRAKSQRKEILEAEAQDAHILLYANLSEPVQEMLLKQDASKTKDQYAAELDALYELWCQGDEAALRDYVAAIDQTERAVLGEKGPAVYEEYYQKMYAERNAAMLENALDCLQSGRTVFFAVGLAHLLGDGGLVDALREAGYTVTLVQ